MRLHVQPISASAEGTRAQRRSKPASSHPASRPEGVQLVLLHTRSATCHLLLWPSPLALASTLGPPPSHALPHVCPSGRPWSTMERRGTPSLLDWNNLHTVPASTRNHGRLLYCMHLYSSPENPENPENSATRAQCWYLIPQPTRPIRPCTHTPRLPRVPVHIHHPQSALDLVPLEHLERHNRGVFHEIAHHLAMEYL